MGYQQFDTPGRVLVRVDNKAGDVRLKTHTATSTEVEVSAVRAGGEDLVGSTRVEHFEDDGRHRVVVEVPSPGGLLKSLLRGANEVLVTVRAPEGADLEVSTSSGDVGADGRFGCITIDTASGDVSAGTADGDVEIHSASGHITVGSVGGRTEVASASGDVRCGTLGDKAELKTASGDISVQVSTGHLSVASASGDVNVGELVQGCELRTGSGDQRVGRLVAGPATFESASGDVTVAVARGTLLAVEAETVSGEVLSEIELGQDWPPSGEGDDGAPGPKAQLNADSVSGDVRVKRAGT